MKAYEKKDNPMQQYIKHLRKPVRQIQREGFVLIGDMHINIQNDKPTTKRWNPSTEQSGMVNVQQAWWPQLRHKCITWRNGDSKSWIDHVYADIKTMTDNSITGVGISTGEWDHDSDHSMIGIRVNLRKWWEESEVWIHYTNRDRE